MTPHPQSRASLLALNEQLRREAYSRARVYEEMPEKLFWDVLGRLMFWRCP